MCSASGDFGRSELCTRLLEQINRLAEAAPRSFRFMEVCGTHTVALFRSGIAQALPQNIKHLSGPGCPVCVTHDSEIAAAINLAERKDVHLFTFGDLMRVPGPKGATLKKAKAKGALVDIIYSPLEALDAAENDPSRMAVFLGVGFETTAPLVAATVLEAKRRNIKNFTVLSFHKLVPPALRALLDAEAKGASAISGELAPGKPGSKAFEKGVDGFLLPGHVSVILGVNAYDFLSTKYNKPAVVTGFEPVDLLGAILLLLKMQQEGKPSIINEYGRVVDNEGNPRAKEIMDTVFKTANAKWRGLGLIPDSGLVFNDDFAEFDATRRLNINFEDVPPPKGCMCGEALAGLISPKDCPLFGKACTPAHPVGPCMVSTEGSCAAYYNYSL